MGLQKSLYNTGSGGTSVSQESPIPQWRVSIETAITGNDSKSLSLVEDFKARVPDHEGSSWWRPGMGVLEFSQTLAEGGSQGQVSEKRLGNMGTEQGSTGRAHGSSGFFCGFVTTVKTSGGDFCFHPALLK